MIKDQASANSAEITSTENQNDKTKHTKCWPKDCPWPEPCRDLLMYSTATLEEIEDSGPLDEYLEELVNIREYFDGLVEEGFLDEHYQMNEEYEANPEDNDDGSNDDLEDWEPELGEDYWVDGRFDLESWEFEAGCRLNSLKIDPCDASILVQQILGYDFVNENILRQAFTRRAFAVEQAIGGDNEQLEFYGDSILNTIVTREIYREFSYADEYCPAAPFRCSYKEGSLSRIRTGYVSKEYLSKRAMELGLDKYILYGTGEEESESARADMMEALIGAVAADSNWNWGILGDVVDRLVCPQMHKADSFLHATYYETFNSWHQKHFHKMPEYEVYGSEKSRYHCTIRFFVPKNEKNIQEYQRIDVDGFTRNESREEAAMKAYFFVVGKGLWINLKDAGVVPDLENSINQLQELYQKKYVEQPRYDFKEDTDGRWFSDCFCESAHGYGKAHSKIKAKKKAAYMTIVRLLEAAGICEESWRKQVWESID